MNPPLILNSVLRVSLPSVILYKHLLNSHRLVVVKPLLIYLDPPVTQSLTHSLVGRGPTSASTGGRVSHVYKSCSIVAPPLSPAFVILQGDHYTFSGLMSPRTACRYSHTCCRFLMHRWLNLWQRKVGVKLRSSQASLSKRFPIVFRRYTCNRSKGTKVYCHSHLRTITG